MSFTSIHIALDTQLQSIDDLPDFTTEGDLTKLRGGSYIRGTLMPAKTELPTFDGKLKRENGKYQVDITVKAPSDYTTAYAYLDTLLAAFTATTDLSQDGLKIRILNSYPLTVRNPTSAYFSVAAIIEWECWV
jgi:hypothetical protein